MGIFDNAYNNAVHILVDYSFLYYKYKFQLESGRMKRLTTSVNRGLFDFTSNEVIDNIANTLNGSDKVEIDISQVYFSIKEIEKFRKDAEKHYNKPVILSVCFDMPTDRKEKDADNTGEESKYKSNRHKLSERDFFNIQLAESILRKAGYNTYRINGLEADDIVYWLLTKYKNQYNENIIFTPDADLLVNICDNVSASRYKSKVGYTMVTKSNFSEYLSKEFKCTVPYNALMLYKITVGDKSDCIDGIKGFGPAGFTKLVNQLNKCNIRWEECGNASCIKVIIDTLRDSCYFNANQIKQMENSLELVKPKALDFAQDELLFRPTKKSTYELREEAYMPFGMKSLV